ncbi:MAG: hypothetical protein AAF138_05285 [Planctomycetota bacterium]
MLFPLYGVLVWWLVFRGRRRWSGLGWLAAGEAVLAMVALFHAQLGKWGSIQIESLQLLLYSYAGLLALVGVFLFVQPRVYAVRGRRLCRACGYDLVGIIEDKPTCPECGKTFDPEVFKPARPNGSVRESQLSRWAPETPEG